MARMKSHDGSGSDSGGSRKGNSNSRGRGRNSGGRGGKTTSSEAGRDDVCKYCGKKGHWAKECRKKKRDEEA